MTFIRKLVDRTRTLQGRLVLSTLLTLLLMCLLLAAYEAGIGAIVDAQAGGTFRAMSEEMNGRLARNIEDIARTAKVAAYSATVQEQLLAKTRLARLNLLKPALEVMKIAIDSTDKVKNVSVRTVNGSVLTFSTFGLTELESALASVDLSAESFPTDPFFGPLFDVDTGTSHIPHVMLIIPVYNILPEHISREPLGICAVLCDVRALTGTPAGFPNDGFAAMLNGDEPLLSNRPLDAAEQAALAEAARDVGSASPTGRIRSGGLEYRSWSVQIREIGLRYMAVCPELGLRAQWVPIRRAGLAILFLALGLIPTMMWLAIRGVSEPMREILGDMDGLESARAGGRIRVPANRDLARLSASINRMLDRIEDAARTESESQAKLHRAQLEQQKAQLLGYRSQINPHFLFNTLECMRSMAQVEGNPYIEKLCSAMSGMFRYSLKSGPVVELEQELTHTVHYFNVMSLRHPGRYHLRIHVTEAARKHPVHPMILQPLVENAIQHGFADRTGFCTVLVTARADSRSRLLLHVIDDGCGIEPGRVAHMNRRLTASAGDAAGDSPGDASGDAAGNATGDAAGNATGDAAGNATDNFPGISGSEPKDEQSIGLMNIHRRLENTFGSGYAMTIRSKIGKYAAVRIVIPQEQSPAASPSCGADRAIPRTSA